MSWDIHDSWVAAEFSVAVRNVELVSINKLYFTRAGKRALTREGEKLKSRLTAEVVRGTQDAHFDPDSGFTTWKEAVDLVYVYGGFVAVEVDLYFTDTLDPKWVYGKPNAFKGGKARSPYKIRDSSNYVKIIHDAIADGTGIDDCCNCMNTDRKHVGAETRIDITYKVMGRMHR